MSFFNRTYKVSGIVKQVTHRVEKQTLFSRVKSLFVDMYIEFDQASYELLATDVYPAVVHEVTLSYTGHWARTDVKAKVFQQTFLNTYVVTQQDQNYAVLMKKFDSIVGKQVAVHVSFTATNYVLWVTVSPISKVNNYDLLTD